MATVKSDQRMQVFRATDAFAVEAYRAASALSKLAEQALAVEIRKSAVRSGGAVVAASASAPGGQQEQEHLERARIALVEGRYYLYLARRFGLLDTRRYRTLTSRQDAALRELQALLSLGPASPGAS